MNERERFEAWREANFPTDCYAEKDDKDRYISATMRAGWEAWQAALRQQGELTEAMIGAALKIDWADSDVRGNIINMWNAMIAAKP